MWIILDLIIVAIVLLFVFISAKRGFARTVVEFVGYILAVYLAFTVGGIISTAVYDGVIEPAIVSSTTEKIVDTAGESVDSTVNDVWDSLPDLVTKGAESFGITSDYLKNTLNENSVNTENATVIAENAVSAIAEPVIVPLLKSIIGIILFAVLIFVVRILAKAINKVFKLPLIGGLNKFLGGVVGGLKGIVISFIFVIIIGLIMSFTENGFLIFTEENIEQTYLFKILMNFSPFK